MPVALPLLAQPKAEAFHLGEECLLLTKDLCDGLPQDRTEQATDENAAQSSTFHRGFHRILHDEGEILRAPFKRSAIGWDAGVLLGTGALIASDRQTIAWTPKGGSSTAAYISDGAIYGTATAAGVIWLSGAISHDAHQNETGLLTLEALVDAMPIYTGIQVIAGRERPGDAAGHGRFLQRHSVDGSFPAGHAMFAFTMATVVAHEYPRWWVKALLYGAATTVAVSRFVDRDHFASDSALGGALGYFIGRYVFHAHCNPEFSEDCHASR